MSQQEDQKYVYPQRVTPRIQWDANFGYCGETSFICAGMSFGQYCSQYTARSLASYGMDQARQGSQLLLGTDNALKTAREMRLQAFAFDSQVPGSENDDVSDLVQATHKFLATVKSNLLAGGVPIIGVFNNCDLLGEGKARNYGDGQYDHIVPIVGWVSHHPLNQERADQYIADDAVILSDNGLYTPGDPATPPFLFPYEVGSFQGTREQANNPLGPLYMLKWQPENFGVVIQGVAIKQADPPAAVNEAFKEVTAAQQQAESYINQANAYAMQLTQKAQGEAAAFDKVYEEYRLAPDVTRRRMYYETMERVLQNVDKTIVEVPGVTPYLPLPAIRGPAATGLFALAVWTHSSVGRAADS